MFFAGWLVGSQTHGLEDAIPLGLEGAKNICAKVRICAAQSWNSALRPPRPTGYNAHELST